jgi:hypothetical protein
MSDDMLISRAIDALKDPIAQAVAEAIVDRVVTIVGDHELHVRDDQAAFTAALDHLTEEQLRILGQLESMKTQMGRLTMQLGELRQEIEALRIAREAGQH